LHERVGKTCETNRLLCIVGRLLAVEALAVVEEIDGWSGRTGLIEITPGRAPSRAVVGIRDGNAFGVRRGKDVAERVIRKTGRPIAR
jgi:hypothetical protein